MCPKNIAYKVRKAAAEGLGAALLIVANGRVQQFVAGPIQGILGDHGAAILAGRGRVRGGVVPVHHRAGHAGEDRRSVVLPRADCGESTQAIGDRRISGCPGRQATRDAAEAEMP